MTLVKRGMGKVGEIRTIDTFATTLSIPRGWMLLDGSVVNQTSYDALHGSGAYLADNITSSPLINKNLYAADNKFAVGKLALTQDGSVARTYEGNSGNTANLQHNHAWYYAQPAGHDNVYDSAGTSVNLTGATVTAGYHLKFSTGTNVLIPGSGDDYLYDSNQLSTAQNIKPESFAVKYMIKVI